MFFGDLSIQVDIHIYIGSYLNTGSQWICFFSDLALIASETCSSISQQLRTDNRNDWFTVDSEGLFLGGSLHDPFIKMNRLFTHC